MCHSFQFGLFSMKFIAEEGKIHIQLHFGCMFAKPLFISEKERERVAVH